MILACVPAGAANLLSCFLKYKKISQLLHLVQVWVYHIAITPFLLEIAVVLALQCLTVGPLKQFKFVSDEFVTLLPPARNFSWFEYNPKCTIISAN